MIPVTQTKVVVKNSKGETVVNGNCYASAIASMLEVPITEVPNVEMFFDTSFDYEWLMNAWLKEKHGCRITDGSEFRIFHPEKIQEEIEQGLVNFDIEAEKEKLKDQYYFVIGHSPRGVLHITIYKNGEMIHDPHPTREGLLDITQFQKLEKI